jgi:hypothetical protein
MHLTFSDSFIDMCAKAPHRHTLPANFRIFAHYLENIPFLGVFIKRKPEIWQNQEEED